MYAHGCWCYSGRKSVRPSRTDGETEAIEKKEDPSNILMEKAETIFCRHGGHVARLFLDKGMFRSGTPMQVIEEGAGSLQSPIIAYEDL